MTLVLDALTAILPWLGALCSVAAGVAVLIRLRAPLAPQAGIFLLALATDLALSNGIVGLAHGPLASVWTTLAAFLHITLLTTWLSLVLAITSHPLAARTAWWVGAAMLLLAVVGAAGVGALSIGTPGVPALSETLPGLSTASDSRLWLSTTSISVIVLSAGLLAVHLTRAQGRQRRLAIAALASLVLTSVIAGLESVNGALADVSLVRVVFSVVGCVAAFAVFRGLPWRARSVAQSALFEHIRDAVVVLDAHRQVMHLNAAAQELLGLPERPASDTPLDRIWPASAGVLEALETAPSGSIEHVFTVAGVGLKYAIAQLPLEGLAGSGDGRVLVFRNVTDRDSMERALRERAQGLSRTNRLLTALATVTARVGSTTDPRQVWETLGVELRRLELHCAIASIDPNAEAATIRYVSFAPDQILAIARLAKLQILGTRLPRKNWPGERLLQAHGPIWDGDARKYLLSFFPNLPDAVIEPVLRVLGIRSDSQICLLPLTIEERLIGVMPIWGADIGPDDNPVLTAFAGQVAGILASADAHAQEIERTGELSRSNVMLLALSRVAARLDSTSDFMDVVEVLGQELRKLNVDCLVGTVDEGKQNMRIQYISVSRDVIRWAERITGHTLAELEIPRRLWPSDRVVTERVPYWDIRGMRGTLGMFPILSESIHRRALQLAGLNLDDPVCYLPLAHDEDVIGVLAVWGGDLRAEDLPALSVFSTQLATAIRNNQMFEHETRRAQDLALLLKASEATASTSELDQVLSILAAQLLEISGFEACQVAEWDRSANRVHARLQRSRIVWDPDRCDTRALAHDQVARQVLETGLSHFEPGPGQPAPNGSKRNVLRLSIHAQGRRIGLAELTAAPNRVFGPETLARCQVVLSADTHWLVAPLSLNPRERLLALQEALLRSSGAESTELWQWNSSLDQLALIATAADVTWPSGQGPHFEPSADDARALALDHGEASAVVRPRAIGNMVREPIGSSRPQGPESLVVLPLQNGSDRIGLIELYDYNHERTVTQAQVAFLRMVADKAGFSIHNARLLEETQKRLNEKEVLLKEVHHRVKNNLQVISSLLSLQSARIADTRVKNALRESQNRVRSMALIHEKLYQSADLAQVDFAAYLRSLVTFLAQSYRERTDAVALEVHSADVQLDLETALPCGLIVNELVSNALKHGFPDDRTGTIWVSLESSEGGGLCLRVRDDGIGFPEGASLEPSQSLGLSLVRTLTDQIGGALTVSRGSGTDFAVCFRSER